MTDTNSIAVSDDRLQASCNETNPNTDSEEMSDSFSNESICSERSFDDSFQYFNQSTRDLYEELPTFSIKSMSPYGRTPSPIDNEPTSLLNLSISPIGSTYDPNDVSDDEQTTNYSIYNQSSEYNSISHNDDDERISLDELTAQICTSPMSQSKSASCSKGSTKRLNLETIFEGVFLETPPKKRRLETWHFRTFQEVTAERINTYVLEQQQSTELKQQQQNNETTDHLCTLFEERVDLNVA